MSNAAFGLLLDLLRGLCQPTPLSTNAPSNLVYDDDEMPVRRADHYENGNSSKKLALKALELTGFSRCVPNPRSLYRQSARGPNKNEEAPQRRHGSGGGKPQRLGGLAVC